MKTYKNSNTDAEYNIGLEEKLFEEFNIIEERINDSELFMLWRNDKSVIIGNNQIAGNEVDIDFAKANGINIVRRKTGGGAVYHDLGNVNYTYISKRINEYGNYHALSQPVINFLKTLGINAHHIGNNDIGIYDSGVEKKISGTAQRVKDGYILHHGTLMFDVDLSILERVLTPDPAKFKNKGIKSIRSRVCNIADFNAINRINMTRDEFWNTICDYFGAVEEINILSS